MRKHGFWLSPCSGRARLKLRRGDAIDSAAFFGRLGWRELSFRSMREEDKRLNRATQVPLLSRLMLWLSSDAFREEIRRLSVISLLEKDKV